MNQLISVEFIIQEKTKNSKSKYHYKILPAIYNWSSDPKRNEGGTKVDENFTYSSDQNKEWMSVKDLQQWIKANREKIGQI